VIQWSKNPVAGSVLAYHSSPYLLQFDPVLHDDFVILDHRLHWSLYRDIKNMHRNQLTSERQCMGHRNSQVVTLYALTLSETLLTHQHASPWYSLAAGLTESEGGLGPRRYRCLNAINAVIYRAACTDSCIAASAGTGESILDETATDVQGRHYLRSSDTPTFTPLCHQPYGRRRISSCRNKGAKQTSYRPKYHFGLHLHWSPIHLAARAKDIPLQIELRRIRKKFKK